MTTSSQLFSDRISSSQFSQLFSTALKVVSSLPTSSHLRSTNFTSFSAHLNSSHLLNSGQIFSLFSTLLTSCHRDAYTQSKFLHGEAFTHSKLLHRETLTHRSFYTPQAFTHSKLLHRGVFTHRELSHRKAFTQRNFYTEQVFAQRSCHTGCAQIEKYLLPKHHSQPSCSHYILQFTVLSCKRHYKYSARSRSSEEPGRSHSTAICRDSVAKHKRITHNGYTNCSSKTGSRRPSGKTTILKHCLKGI